MSPTLAQVTLDLLALSEDAIFSQKVRDDALNLQWVGRIDDAVFVCKHDVSWPLVHAAQDLETYLAREAYILWQKVRHSTEFKAAAFNATQPSVAG